MKRKEKISDRVLKSRSWEKNLTVIRELEDIELDKSYMEKRKKEESSVIQKLKKNPKYFYPYQKKFGKTNTKIGGLIRKDGSVATDPLEQSELLREQYESVFSQPREEYVINNAEQFFKSALQVERERREAVEQEEQERRAAEEQEEQEQLVSQCEACRTQMPHQCQGDAIPEDEDILNNDAGHMGRSRQDGISSYISGLEPYGAQCPSDEDNQDILGPDEQLTSDEDNQDSLGPDECHPANPLEVEFLYFDWEDFSNAIEAIPNGASCGPDGIPAIMMKQARIPISIMLSKLFKSCLQTGEIPKILKLAYIVPIHKGGSRAETVNFRPISLTSHVMKTFERVMRETLVNFLEMNMKIDPKQHGSRAGRSTLSQLLLHQDEILSALENGENLDSIYLNFSKAYDKVDHGILVHKLRALGITELLDWKIPSSPGRWQKVPVLPPHIWCPSRICSWSTSLPHLHW